MGTGQPREGDGRRRALPERRLIVAFSVYVIGFLLVVTALHWVVGIGGSGLGGEAALFVAVVVPLVPFLVSLGGAGRLARVSGGPRGIEVLFREADRTIQPTAIVEEAVFEIDRPTTEQALPDYPADADAFAGRTVLSIDLGLTPSVQAVEDFLAAMPQLEYVTFTDGLGEFVGVIPGSEFRAAFGADPTGLVDTIAAGDVERLAGVVTASVPMGATNVEALETMANADDDLLGIVDDEGRFHGVLTQSRLTRDVLLHLFEGANR